MSEKSQTIPVNTVDRGSLLLLLIITFIFIMGYYNIYYVPDSDFFDYSLRGDDLLKGEELSNYKRLPLYSIAMTGLGRLMPGPFADLQAAQVINLTFLLLSVVFLYLFTRQYIKEFALLLLLAYVLNFITPNLTIQPRTELPAVVFALMAFYYIRRAPWAACAAAFLGAVLRYESILIIPILFFMEIAHTKKWVKPFVRALLAGSGILYWIILNYVKTGNINPYHMHFADDSPPAGYEFIERVIENLYSFLPPSLFPVMTALTLLFLIAGFYLMITQDRIIGWGLLAFYLQFTAINLIFFSPTHAHTFMAQWIYLLCILIVLRKAFDRFLQKKSLSSLAAIPVNEFVKLCIAIFVISALLQIIAHVALNKDFSIYMILFDAVFAGSLALILSAVKPFRTARAAGAFLAALISIFVLKQINYNDYLMSTVKYNKADLRAIGEWYDANASGGKMAVTEKLVAAYYVTPQYRTQLINLNELDIAGKEQLWSKMRAEGIDYVAWDTSHGGRKKGSYGYKRMRADLIEDLAAGKSTAHFSHVATVGYGPRIAHIYRVQ